MVCVEIGMLAVTGYENLGLYSSSYLEQVTQLDGFMGPAEFQALLQKDIGEFLATKKKLGLL